MLYKPTPGLSGGDRNLETGALQMSWSQRGYTGEWVPLRMKKRLMQEEGWYEGREKCPASTSVSYSQPPEPPDARLCLSGCW